MITIPALDTICPDLNKYERIARILAQELPGLHLLSEPLDVIDSLEHLSDEMSQMPQVISDCRIATEVFDELDQVIGHMYALADRAVEIPEDNQEQRRLLNDEFMGYSHIVARLAGAEQFDGPSLSLITLGEAWASRKILAYLNEARQGFTCKLADQRRQINQAMDEALGLLVKLVSEVEELSYYNREQLSDLLDRLGAIEEMDQIRHGGYQPARLLH